MIDMGSSCYGASCTVGNPLVGLVVLVIFCAVLLIAMGYGEKENRKDKVKENVMPERMV